MNQAQHIVKKVFCSFAGAIFLSTLLLADSDENKTIENLMPPPQAGELTSVGIKDSNASRITDEYGIEHFSEDLDMSNTKNIHNLLLKNRDFGAEGMGNVPSMFIDGSGGEVYKDAFSGNVDLSTAAIKARHPESNLTKAINNWEELAKSMKERAEINADIQCYIARSIHPSFRCSIPELSGIRYGGDDKTDYKDALAKCEEGCNKPADCIPAHTIAIQNPSIRNISARIGDNGYVVTSKTATSYLISSLELDITVENLDENQSQVENSDKELIKSGDKLVFQVFALREGSRDWQLLLKGGEIPITEFGSKTISVPISSAEIEQIKVSLFKPKTEAPVTLNNLKIHYSGNEHWFCPAIQAVDCSQQHLCLGKIEKRTTDAGYQICICREPMRDIGPDKHFGGFYTQDTCLVKCRHQQQCVPEYSDENGNSVFKVSVGCIEPSENALPNPNCTQQRCMELFASDEQAHEESVLVNRFGNPEMKKTVSGGKTLSSATRPKVQLETERNRPGELLARSTGDYDGVFWLERKDGAFVSMIERGNFVRAPLAAAKSQSAIEVKRPQGINNVVGLDWLLKPESIDIDNQKTYYLYVVLELEHSMKAMSGTYPYVTTRQIDDTVENINMTLSPASHNIQLKHRSFATITNAGKVETYNFHEREQYGIDYNKNGSYSWNLFTSSPNPKFVKVNGDNVALFDENTQAPIFKSTTFNSDTPFYRYPITSNIYNLIETKDLLVKRQDGSNLIFSGMFDPKSRSYMNFYKIHALYSQTPLTYKALHNLIQDDRFAIYSLGGESTYPNQIYGDGSYSSSAKMFLQGPLRNTTIWSDFKPTNDEIGKNGFIFLMLREKQGGF